MNRTQTVLATAALFAIVASVLSTTLPVYAQDPDFSITPTPAGQCITLGGTASYTVTVSSLGGFAGTVQLEDSIDPNVSNGPTLSPIPSSVDVAADQSTSFGLTASTTSSTPNQVYAVTIYGLSGDIVHSATLYLSFEPLCGAAGATVVPVNIFSIVAPFAGMAIAIVGLAGAGTLVYLRRRR